MNENMSFVIVVSIGLICFCTAIISYNHRQSLADMLDKKTVILCAPSKEGYVKGQVQ